MSIRKKLLLLGVPVVLIIIVSILLLPVKQSQPKSATEETEPVQLVSEAIQQTNVKVVSRITEAPTQAIDPAYKWNTYQGETYSFQYPKDWNLQVSALEGGKSIVVRPQVLPEGINYPQFILQAQRTTADVIARKEGVLAGFGLHKESVTVADTEAIAYKGTIPFKLVGTQALQEPIQDRTYMFEKSGIVYVLKVEYEGGSANTALDDFFDGFIASFKTN